MSLNARGTVVMRLAGASIKAMQLALLSLIMQAGSTIFAYAQSYPVETIRIVVPFGPASGPDFAIRALQPTLQELLKQSVRVENRPGANSIIGSRPPHRTATPSSARAAGSPPSRARRLSPASAP
jgi:tripartite-type tricarboxylate transporter receptor subunit TctC